MPRYFTEKLTKEELAAKVVTEARKRSSEYHKTILEEKPSAVGTTYANAYRMGLPVLTPQVEKDLSKIQFDSENLDCEPGRTRFDGDDIGGFHTLPNGLTFLGISAGGDWEVPLYFIIYWDGKKLRAYIPKDGNLYNTDTKMAYGNGEEEFDDETVDPKNIKKRYGIDVEWMDDFTVDYDSDKLVADIEKRIQAK